MVLGLYVTDENNEVEITFPVGQMRLPHEPFFDVHQIAVPGADVFVQLGPDSYLLLRWWLYESHVPVFGLAVKIRRKKKFVKKDKIVGKISNILEKFWAKISQKICEGGKPARWLVLNSSDHPFANWRFYFAFILSDLHPKYEGIQLENLRLGICILKKRKLSPLITLKSILKLNNIPNAFSIIFTLEWEKVWISCK